MYVINVNKMCALAHILHMKSVKKPAFVLDKP